MRYRTNSTRGIPPLADVYTPRDTSSRASVLLVHGGAFVVGSRRMLPMRFLASSLVRAGVSVCVIDYRMLFRGGRLDEALDDVRAALDFWRGRAEARHGLDASRVSLVGLSAGGMLAMLAASRGPTEVHRLVSAFGLYDMDHITRGVPSVVPRLLFRTWDRGAWSRRSPAGEAPPRMATLMLHGTADRMVPVAQARRLAERRERAGLPTELVVYEGAPHGFFNMPGRVAEDAAARIADFVR